jgi:flavin reductase (DIM6/NTAB) family NADH-FMN oxidoreductase RutF
MKGRPDKTLHEVLRQFPYAIYIVGVRGRNGEMNALVASWVTQCSFFPPLLMVAIRRDTLTYKLVSTGKVFSVNLIDKSQKSLARLLVKPSDQVGDKLGKVAHVEEDTGAPILRKALAYAECKVKKIYEPGDHALVIGEIVHSGIHGKGEPLLATDLKWHYGG